MAIGTPYHIGSAAPTSSVTATTVTVGTGSALNDAIIVCTASTGTTGSVTGVTDSKSNSYSLVQRYAANSFEVECWIAQGAAALTTSDTITASWSGAGTTHRMDAMGVSGVATFSAADPAGVATASSTGSTAPNTGATGTLAQSGELAIAVFGYGSGGGTITWGSGYTSMASVQAGATEFLVTGYKALATTAGTTASGTITSAPWTALVVTFQATSGAAPVTWYDATPSGWQALQQTAPTPSMLAYGPAWTAGQIATIPSSTIQMPLDDTGSHPGSTTVIDVETGDVTSASVIAAWINSRNGRAGGYAVNRPTVYLSKRGLYYLGASDDVITPLASTYNLKPGRDYDLWVADPTGSQPAAPIVTNGVPCVATQFSNYSQTGSQYDISVTFDATWTAAFSGATPPPVAITDVIDITVDLAESLATSITVPPVTGGGSGPPPIGWPQLFVEAALSSRAPVVKPGTFILDDPSNGILDTDRLGGADSWTDITAYVINMDLNRPSTREQGPLLSYQASTASITLDNSDGRFDPDNSAGPYATQGGLHAMIPVRVRATFGNAQYFLFYGFADGWEPSLVDYEGGYAELVLNATDGFKVLSGITLAAVANPVGAAETSGARVNRILNAAGWYTDHRKIDTGDTVLQGTTYGSDALSLLQLTADTEIGELYQNGAGYLVFRHRHGILTDTRSTTPQALFGDLPGTVH